MSIEDRWRGRLIARSLAFGLAFGLPAGAGAQTPPSPPPQTAPMTGSMSGMDHGAMPGMAAPGAGGAAGRGYRAAMDRMHKDMMVKPTGKPDLDFARGMIPHHQGAIDMAKVELQYGTDPDMRKLAQAIVEAQETEIAFMKAWIAKTR